MQELRLKPYKITALLKLCLADNERRLDYCNWLLSEIMNSYLDHQSWQRRHGFTFPDMLIHRICDIDLQLIHIKHLRYHFIIKKTLFGVPYRHCIIGPIFFSDTVNSLWYIENIFNLFVKQLSQHEKSYAYFQQDWASVHKAKKSLMNVCKVFGEERAMSKYLWPPRSDLPTKVYSNNPRTISQLKDNMSLLSFNYTCWATSCIQYAWQSTKVFKSKWRAFSGFNVIVDFIMFIKTWYFVCIYFAR